MPRTRLISGTTLQGDDPDWRPLEQLLGLDLVGAFMWMYEIELDDGTRVHAYQHISTRRYIHLGVDGRTFHYVPRSRYREIPPPQAVELAFTDWEELWPQPLDPDIVRAALERIGAGTPDPASTAPAAAPAGPLKREPRTPR